MPTILHHNEQYTELSNMNFTPYSSEYNLVRRTLYSKDNKLIPPIFKLDIDLVSEAPTHYIESNRVSVLSKTNPETLYPIAVRYVTKNNVYVIERPPFRLSVDFKNARASAEAPKVNPVEIWIPWTVMILPLSEIIAGDPTGVKLFFNDGPIQSLSDTVVHGYLPNSYADGRICWSNSFNTLMSQLNVSGPDKVDINYLYSSILNDYMMGGWNTDLGFTYGHLQNNSSMISNSSIKQRAPLISLFANAYDLDKEFAEKFKLVLQNSFGITKRKSHSFVDGSFIKDSNGNLCSRNIFLKLFGFMSCLSLSDTLAFVTELKDIFKKSDRTIGNLVNNSVEYNNSNSNSSHMLYASSLPIKNTCLDNSIDTEYRSISAVVIINKVFDSQVEYITYSNTHGTNFDDILDNSVSNDDGQPHEIFYSQIYNLCKNYYSNEDRPDGILVIEIDPKNKTLSCHDQNYLSKFIFDQITYATTKLTGSIVDNIPYIQETINSYGSLNEA